MRMVIALCDYGLVGVFGILLSAEFSGVNKSRHTIVKLVTFSWTVIAVQILCWGIFGFEFALRGYPFITHLPLIIFLVAAFRKSWLTAVVSVLSAYLCCQIPRWIADITVLFSNDKLYWNLLHIIAMLVIYVLLHRYAVKPVQKLLTHSRQFVLILGVIPLLYYIFDYGTSIYTDLLYSGNPFAVQFMPSVMAASYFFFLLVYYSKLEEYEKNQRERELLTLQLRRSEAEFSAMRQMQEQARQYRHDLRHHFSLLLGYAQANQIERIKDYLHNTQQDLDTFTPKRFCGNDVVDLLLSYFSGRAESVGVKLSIEATLSGSLPFEDTELCSLLSNGLENAIIAAGSVSEPAARTVAVRLCLRQKNLLLSIRNPYTGKVTIVDGLPVAEREEHGFGIRSIVSIVNSHGGQVSFSAEDNSFLLRVILPMKD